MKTFIIQKEYLVWNRFCMYGIVYDCKDIFYICKRNRFPENNLENGRKALLFSGISVG